MHFPPGFDLELALGQGRLIEAAYDGFQSLEAGTAWTPPEASRLIREIKYSVIAGSILDKESPIGHFILKLPVFKERKISEIPIGFVARQGRTIHFIFRGTQTSIEWINNLNAGLEPFFLEDHGSVHEGFLTVYLNIRDQLHAIAQTLGPRHRIHVAGHSLGAALAAFAACDLQGALGLKVASLYTFGAPRMGDNAFATAFNRSFARKSFRIANSCDMVTEVPFPVKFAGFLGGYFAHIDTPVPFTVQENDSIKNHQMATYLAALSKGRTHLFRRWMHGFGWWR
jgi:triacylglycerol lipase